jgi:hypothetical protein
MVAGESLTRRRVRVGGGPQHEARVSRGGMHHDRTSHAETGDAQSDGG